MRFSLSRDRLTDSDTKRKMELICNPQLKHLCFQRKLQDDLDEVNNKWRSVKENFEKFEDDTKEKLEDEKRKAS